MASCILCFFGELVLSKENKWGFVVMKLRSGCRAVRGLSPKGAFWSGSVYIAIHVPL